MAGTSKQKTKNQHTAPRCYLRGFADRQGWFHYFDKQAQRADRVNVKSATAFDYFYDFEPSTLQNPADDPQWVETTFSLLEKRFKEVLDGFIAEAKAGEVSVDTANEMAHYVAIQWMRTKGFRDTLLELDKKSKQAFLDQLYAENHPGMRPGKFTPGKGYAEAFHAQSIFDGDQIFDFAEMFWNLLWVVGRNRTDKPLYTSDDPVARKQHPIENRSSGPLPLAVGIEYVFPLNSEFALVMMDRRMFHSFKDSERKTLEFTAEDVERYNAMQVMNSTQYVFCEKKDFELAERLCKKHPEICDANRERAQVNVGFSQDGVVKLDVTLPG
jgi:hypothetical protein